MTYGICNLGMIPVTAEPTDESRILNQLLYGESFSILEIKDKWTFIRSEADDYEGWIDNNQYVKLSEGEFQDLRSEEKIMAADLIEYISDQHQSLMPVPLGAVLNGISKLHHRYDGNHCIGKRQKENLIPTAYLYLNAPFLNGGRTPFGIDSSGLVQMVYRLNGFELPREITDQSTQGEPLSFIEESEPGDLAFFETPEGTINHVGIMMADNYIIHAFGKVRIDRIDHSGIYNGELNRHTHRLRVLKKIV